MDPKRPHIVYSVPSDAIGVDDEGNRLNWALPCSVRDNSSDGLFGTGAKVTDCVEGESAGATRWT